MQSYQPKSNYTSRVALALATLQRVYEDVLADPGMDGEEWERLGHASLLFTAPIVQLRTIVDTLGDIETIRNLRVWTAQARLARAAQRAKVRQQAEAFAKRSLVVSLPGHGA